jgi:hypothetical protein
MTGDDAIRVRLLARHFNDLQGIRFVLVGLVGVCACSGYLSTGNAFVALALLGAAFPVIMFGMIGLDRFYARRFGRVRGGANSALVIVAALTSLSVVDSHLMGLPSACWALWSLWPAWIVWDCWPLRRYHLFTVAGALYVSFTHVRVPSISEDVWLAQGMLILSWTFVATGLADHLLLVHLTQRSTGGAVNQGAH